MKNIDFNLIIAALAFVVSVFSLVITFRTTKDQTLTFILNQLDKRATEANSIVYNYPSLYAEHILGKVVSVIVSTEQLLLILEDKYAKQLSQNDKDFLREQFYLVLHTNIRTELWLIQEGQIESSIIRQQLNKSQEFLLKSHLKWD